MHALGLRSLQTDGPKHRGGVPCQVPCHGLETILKLHLPYAVYVTLLFKSQLPSPNQPGIKATLRHMAGAFPTFQRDVDQG
jgi:hypothetical protein